MSKIVRTVSELLMAFVFTFGLYMIMHGHVTPGGGFQGGAVFASGMTLLVVAFGAEKVEKRLRASTLSVLESTGALAFIGLALGGVAVGFFYNFLVGSSVFGHIPAFGPNRGDMWTGGTIPLMNMAVGLKVIAGLSLIVFVMALAVGKGRSEQ
ncbi:MAG: MnhB domain-containing protein [Thermodesulfobacteriota bacterium]|nr:MnhB domain-containing protein [Thermodesulfobacteriota bacterium]